MTEWRHGPLVSLVTGGMWLASSSGVHDPPMVVGLALFLVGPPITRTLRSLVAAIVAGSIVLGSIAGGGIVVVGAPIDPLIAAGIGAAVGGGAGSAVWLFAPGDDAPGTDLTLGLDEAPPAPQPEDLFEANPDPILFVGGPGPDVLAANAAFGDVFGLDVEDLEGRPMTGRLRVGRGADAIVTAVEDGRSLETTVSCETDQGTARARVKVVPTGGAHGAAYIVYGPIDTAR